MKKYVFKYNMIFVNVLSILIFVAILLFTAFLGISFNICHIKDVIVDEKYYVNISIGLLLLLTLVYMVIHEFVHGVFYIINGADRKNIKYGAALENGIFFTKCGELIDKKNIMMSLMAPFVFLGIVTYILSIVMNSIILLYLSVMNIAGCAGDIMMFFFFLKRRNDIKFIEFGDSTTFGLITSENLKNKKLMEVKLIKEVDEFEEDKTFTKKVTISKASYVILFFLLLIVIVYELLMRLI